MKPLLLTGLALVTLTGCQTPETNTVAPGQATPSSEILLGHIPGGLPSGFYDHADTNARAALVRYIELSDQITATGGSEPQAMSALVGSDWWLAEQEGFAYFVDTGLRTVGTSEISKFLVQSARLTSQGTVEVGVIACVDTTGVFVLPLEADEPPEEIWQWHPDYEDFEGDAAQWAALEAFLEQPQLSWGSQDAVVFWFEGPTLDSLVLTRSEPWWGVYPCV
jgi:hypothetical protein